MYAASEDQTNILQQYPGGIQTSLRIVPATLIFCWLTSLEMQVLSLAANIPSQSVNQLKLVA